MEILKEYELKPIKGIFSSKTEKNDTPNDFLFNISREFGFLTESEYNLLLGLMNKENPNVNKDELKLVLENLVKRGIIEKKSNF